MAHLIEGSRRAGALIVALPAALLPILLIGLAVASPASAAYQQVGTFAGNPGELHKGSEDALWPEKVQLGGLSGMAVNYTGAGGVAAGTIYAVTAERGGSEAKALIARYRPDRSFGVRWSVLLKNTEEKREGLGESPYERCGPEGEAANPHCVPKPEASPDYVDVDIDQATGNVYVFAYALGAGTPLITVYSPDGSEVIARFGEKAANSDTVAESPAKIHETSGVGAIAVNAAGEVYVFDLGNPKFYHRLMVFKPKTLGDYSEYEYAGQSHDIAAGFLYETNYPTKPVVDAAGMIYTAEEGNVEKHDPAHPADPPTCSFEFKKGGITAMTVDPLSGEVFFFSYQDKKVHRLSPCAEGKFSEAEAIEIAPGRKQLNGMAVDPLRQFDLSRPAGILYAGSAGSSGGATKGEYPNTEVESALGYVFAPPLEAPPAILAESVSGVTQSSARLEGRIDPKGLPTRYHFQYIPDAAYQANEEGERFAGAQEAPLGGAGLEGSKAIPVAASIGGLSPDTLYHYRLIAASHCVPAEPAEECIAEGAGKSFRTYPSGGLGLPDGRAYELVSPVEKSGGEVFPADPVVNSCPYPGECKPGEGFKHFPVQSSPDGEAIVYEGNPFSFEGAGLVENQYIARRGPGGWQTTNLTPAAMQSKGSDGGFVAFGEDLGASLLLQQSFPLTAAGPAGFANFYRQPSAAPGALERLLETAPPNRPPGQGGFVLSYAGASTDLSRVFFAANDALTEDAQGGAEGKANLYEWSAGGLALLNLAPGNATTIADPVFGSARLLGGGGGGLFDVVIAHAVSADGARAFFTSEADGHLYLREGGETLEVPGPGSCAAALAVSERTCFLTAAEDGSRVLLSDGLLFDAEDLAAPPQDLTQGHGGFEGVAGESEDLSRIYFLDTEVLSGEEENEYGDKAEAGKHNLYAWHEGALAYIATLASADNVFNNPYGSDWAHSPQNRTAEASPDGGWLAFSSVAPLSGFDNTGPCAVVSGTDNYNPAPCSEIFLYRASTGELRCASCKPSGAAPSGPSTVRKFHESGAATAQSRYLTDSGRLYFDSQDSLSPADTNGRVEDVYQFEPAGVGDCERAAGCLALISAGRSGVDSNFLAADPSGKNVFFTSRDRLVEADRDELIDLYDAREGGGFPPAAGEGECQGEACLPAAAPPLAPTPASASFRGAGNVKSAARKGRRCPKGRRRVRRKGKVRCVKRKHRRHHKRHAHRQKQANRNRGGAR